jgi:hypothetical protein
MDWQFDRAPDGSIILTGEIDLCQTQEFVSCLAFGESRHRAIATLATESGFPIFRKAGTIH